MVLLNPEKIRHEFLTDLSTSPFGCSHYLGKSRNVTFNSIVRIHSLHISDYLRLFRGKQTVIHLPTPAENVTTLTCELQNFFVWQKVCCVLSNVVRSNVYPGDVFSSLPFLIYRRSLEIPRQSWRRLGPGRAHSDYAAAPILSVFPALIVHSELKSVHPGFPVAFIF